MRDMEMNDKTFVTFSSHSVRFQKTAESFEIVGRYSPEGPFVLSITGRVLGVEAASLVDTVCMELDDESGHMIVDLTGCSFFSSVALGFMFAFADQRQQHGCRLVVATSSDSQIRKMFEIMGMEYLFEFTESLDGALRRVKEINGEKDGRP